MLFDRVATVEYRTVSGTYGNQVYVPHPGFVGGVPINIQPMNPMFSNMADGMTYKSYKAFVTNSGIVEDFRLTISGTGERYLVRGRSNYGFIALPHYELTVIRDDQ